MSRMILIQAVLLLLFLIVVNDANERLLSMSLRNCHFLSFNDFFHTKLILYIQSCIFHQKSRKFELKNA